MSACKHYKLTPAMCPLMPWCGCEPNLPAPMPEPEQTDIYDFLGDDE